MQTELAHVIELLTAKRDKLTGVIEELRTLDNSAPAPGKSPAKRVITEAARKAISAAQRRRRAAERKSRGIA